MASVGEISLGSHSMTAAVWASGSLGLAYMGGDVEFALFFKVKGAFEGEGGGFGQPLQPGLAQHQVEVAQGLQGGGSQYRACRTPPQAVGKVGCAADGAGVENVVVFVVGTAGYPFCQRLFAFEGDGGEQIPNRADLFDTDDEDAELAGQAVEERAVLFFFAARGGKRIVQPDNVFEQAARSNGRIGNGGFEAFGDFAVFPQPSRFAVGSSVVFRRPHT